MNLKGILPDKAVQSLAQLTSAVSLLTDRFNTLSSRALVDKPSGDILWGPATQKAALQVNGSNPLQVTGLIGTLAQPQIPLAINVTSAPTSGAAAQPGSIVVINGVLYRVVGPGVTVPLGATAIVLQGTHAARPAVGSIAPGTMYYETDRHLLYQVVGANWVYCGGVMVGLEANQPTGFTASDAGVPYVSTDAHVVSFWTGAVWQQTPDVLTAGQFWVGNAGSVPVSVNMSGDATLAAGGILTLAASGTPTGLFGDATHVAQFQVDSKGRITSVTNVPISAGGTSGTYTPLLTLGGAGTGITYASQLGVYSLVNGMVTVGIHMGLSSKGTATGAAYIDLPFLANSANVKYTGTVAIDNCTGMGIPVALVYPNASQLLLGLQQAGGINVVTDANLTNGSEINVTVTYQS